MSKERVTPFIFLITLTIQTSAIVWPWTKHTIFVTSEMSNNNKPVDFHCWSHDDDLGHHILYMKDTFNFSFHEDQHIPSNTRFDCDVVHGTQKVRLRLYPRHCSTFENCYWVARDDGFYVGKDPNSLGKVQGWT